MNADLFRPKGKRPARREADYYPTPLWVIEEALNLVEGLPERILDPGAGEGQWGAVARQRWPLSYVEGVEVREIGARPKDYDLWTTGDFLDNPVDQQGYHWPPIGPFDLVMGNPPYAHSEAFVRHGLSLLREGGELVFLLRLQFLCGQARARGLYREHPPADIAFCAKRVSFYGGGTGSEDYCVLHWVKGWHGESRVHWVGVTE